MVLIVFSVSSLFTFARFPTCAQDSEAFSDQLLAKLSNLEGANVGSLLTNEEGVNQLVHRIDSSLEQVDRFEQTLVGYLDLFSMIQTQMGVPF